MTDDEGDSKAFFLAPPGTIINYPPHLLLLLCVYRPHERFAPLVYLLLLLLLLLLLMISFY